MSFRYYSSDSHTLFNYRPVSNTRSCEVNITALDSGVVLYWDQVDWFTNHTGVCEYSVDSTYLKLIAPSREYVFNCTYSFERPSYYISKLSGRLLTKEEILEEMKIEREREYSRFSMKTEDLIKINRDTQGGISRLILVAIVLFILLLPLLNHPE